MNFDQLAARERKSRFSLRKVSEVVPDDMNACESVKAEWYIDDLDSRASCEATNATSEGFISSC